MAFERGDIQLLLTEHHMANVPVLISHKTHDSVNRLHMAHTVNASVTVGALAAEQQHSPLP